MTSLHRASDRKVKPKGVQDAACHANRVTIKVLVADPERFDANRREPFLPRGVVLADGANELVDLVEVEARLIVRLVPISDPHPGLFCA